MRIATAVTPNPLHRRFIAVSAFILILITTSVLVSHRASAADAPLPDSTQTGVHQEAQAVTPAQAILERLGEMGLIPEQAAQLLGRGAVEHAEVHAPGRACERILQAERAAPEVIERCRAALVPAQPGTGADPAQLCRRALQNPVAAGSVLQRCRAWLDSQGTAPASPTPAEVCRRIATADEPDAALIERCRMWLDSQSEAGHPTVRELCARILAADAAPESLVERCEALMSAQQDIERPVRPERPERSAASQSPTRR